MWFDELLPGCPDCKEMYTQKVPPAEPPCHKCRVDLLEENREAGEIFSICSGQVITAPMGGVIDINNLAIESAMRIYGVKDQKTCLKKVRRLFFISQRNLKAKKEENDES